MGSFKGVELMPQWNPDLLNRHIAPGIADFKECHIPDLSVDFEDASRWMSTLFFVSAIQAEYKGAGRQFAANIVFRAHASFDLYHEARMKTMTFIEKSGSHNPHALLYYASIRTWESCLISLQALLEVISNFSGEKLYERSDGSPLQRTNDMANTVKHWGAAITRNEHEDGDTLPVWLSSEGLVTRKYVLEYTELADLIRDAGVSAREMCNPVVGLKSLVSEIEGSVK
jgi:hypothetical protein